MEALRAFGQNPNVRRAGAVGTGLGVVGGLGAGASMIEDSMRPAQPAAPEEDIGAQIAQMKAQGLSAWEAFQALGGDVMAGAGPDSSETMATWQQFKAAYESMGGSGSSDRSGQCGSSWWSLSRSRRASAGGSDSGRYANVGNSCVSRSEPGRC